MSFLALCTCTEFGTVYMYRIKVHVHVCVLVMFTCRSKYVCLYTHSQDAIVNMGAVMTASEFTTAAKGCIEFALPSVVGPLHVVHMCMCIGGVHYFK